LAFLDHFHSLLAEVVGLILAVNILLYVEDVVSSNLIDEESFQLVLVLAVPIVVVVVVEDLVLVAVVAVTASVEAQYFYFEYDSA
jgi:hypothetical protein